MAIAALGFAAFVVALLMSRSSKGGNFEVLLGVIGLKTGIVAGAIAVISHVRVVRRYDRLMRGEGVLARWNIDAARWRVFLEASRRLAETPKALPNEVKVPVEIPPDGIEVVISDNALRLGRDFHLLAKAAVVRVDDPIIEFEQLEPAGKSSTRRVMYRVPFAGNAAAEAERVASHYVTAGAASMRSIRKVAIVALIAMIGVLAWIIIWLVNVVY